MATTSRRWLRQESTAGTKQDTTPTTPLGNDDNDAITGTKRKTEGAIRQTMKQSDTRKEPLDR